MPDAAGEDEAAAAFGLTVLRTEVETSRLADPRFAVWPENLAAARLFMSMQTQWRMGPAGAIGLDYGVLPSWCRLGSSRSAQRVMSGLQTMESEWLCAFAEARQAESGR